MKHATLNKKVLLDVVSQETWDQFDKEKMKLESENAPVPAEKN